MGRRAGICYSASQPRLYPEYRAKAGSAERPSVTETPLQLPASQLLMCGGICAVGLCICLGKEKENLFVLAGSLGKVFFCYRPPRVTIIFLHLFCKLHS